MEGLPQSPGAVGIAMVFLGVLLAALYAVWMRRAGGANGGGYALGTPFVWIALTLIMFSPYIAWRIVEDVRYTSSLNSWIADRYGVSVVQVHPAIFDAAAAHMPLHARYYLATSSQVDSTRRQAFEQWAAGWLLPRVATSTAPQAGWVLTLGVKPLAVDRRVTRTWRIWPAVDGTPPAYLGEVGR